MTRPYWIMPDQLFDKDRLHRDMALQISDGRVAAVVTACHGHAYAGPD
jgi:hypothetical protein